MHMGCAPYIDFIIKMFTFQLHLNFYTRHGVGGFQEGIKTPDIFYE